MSRYLILGASSEVALAFLRRQPWQAEDEIIAQYRHGSDSLAGLAKEFPAKLTTVQADFLSATGTAGFAAQLNAMGFVPTHILHTPALPVANARFTELSWDDMEQQLFVQCRSLVGVLQAVIKRMAKAKGGKVAIVLTSYTLGVPPKYLAGYVMAKYALLGLGKALAAEYAAKGIQVNMVSPSLMETKFLQNIHSSISEQSAAANPQRRNATPDDVAGLLVYLFSPQNTFVTGANIPVTGGEMF